MAPTKIRNNTRVFVIPTIIQMALEGLVNPYYMGQKGQYWGRRREMRVLFAYIITYLETQTNYWNYEDNIVCYPLQQ